MIPGDSGYPVIPIQRLQPLFGPLAIDQAKDLHLFIRLAQRSTDAQHEHCAQNGRGRLLRYFHFRLIGKSCVLDALGESYRQDIKRISALLATGKLRSFGRWLKAVLFRFRPFA